MIAEFKFLTAIKDINLFLNKNLKFISGYFSKENLFLSPVSRFAIFLTKNLSV